MQVCHGHLHVCLEAYNFIDPTNSQGTSSQAHLLTAQTVLGEKKNNHAIRIRIYLFKFFFLVLPHIQNKED